MRSDIYASLDILAGWEFYVEFYVMGHVGILIAMDKGLIQIKNHSFLA